MVLWVVVGASSLMPIIWKSMMSVYSSLFRRIILRSISIGWWRSWHHWFAAAPLMYISSYWHTLVFRQVFVMPIIFSNMISRLEDQYWGAISLRPWRSHICSALDENNVDDNNISAYCGMYNSIDSIYLSHNVETVWNSGVSKLVSELPQGELHFWTCRHVSCQLFSWRMSI